MFTRLFHRALQASVSRSLAGERKRGGRRTAGLVGLEPSGLCWDGSCPEEAAKNTPA